MTIKILGSGCANCEKVEGRAKEAADYLGLQAEFIKVTDYGEISNYPILATPGLVVNEKLVCSGRIPAMAEITTWLADAALEEG